MVVRAGLVIALGLLSFMAADTAHAGLLDGLVAPRPMRRNPGVPPPMDQRPIAGVEYRTDDLGRSTYLSLECLRVAVDYSSECVQREQYQHALAIRKVDDEANRRAQDEASAAHLRESQKRWAEEAARRRAAEPPPAPKLSPIAQHALQVHNLKLSLARLQRMLDNEKQVAAVSGATNVQMRYNLGTAIVMNRRNLAIEYEAYRRAGGTKPLSAL